jgi:glycosyltransferase involved in cell wall biosynthesis
MRVAINLLTEDPANPSGAHWCWTRVVPEMARRLADHEELHLLVSPRSRPLHQGYGPNIRFITFPWSNESPPRRTLSEHVYSPIRLPMSKIDLLSTLIAPIVRPAPSVVVHFKTLHAYTTPRSIRPTVRMYRRMSYPRTVRVADAVIVNSESLRQEVLHYLDVDPAKLHLVPEAVDHEVFRPGDREEAWHDVSSRHGLSKPFILFVSSLWPYKNCAGLIRAFAAARRDLGDRQLVVLGYPRDAGHAAELRGLADRLGVTEDVVWIGGVPLKETVAFYRCADVLVYPSFNETFGLPILEAMATGCPVVTSDTSSMPETAGGCALLVDPADPQSIADAMIKACGPAGERLRALGPQRAQDFSWAVTAERTLEVYREVHARRSMAKSTR